VLDGVDGVVARSELRAALAAAYLADISPNLRQTSAIGPPENYALTTGGRLESDLAANSEVKSNALEDGRAR
jgi:hypothetical protein